MEKTPWDFVEKYYPNYYSCPLILESEDLLKVIEDKSNSSRIRVQAEMKHNAILVEIYEKAITNFTNQK